jgi:hypothetical protein
LMNLGLGDCSCTTEKMFGNKDKAEANCNDLD